MTFSSDPSLNTNQLPISLDVKPEEEDYQAILLLYLRRIANAVNTKESGLFLLQEVANFEQWFQTSTPTSSSSQQNRNAYRLTVDFVSLNAGNIPTGTTSLSLSTTTQPVAPLGYLYPVQGFGGATDTAGISYFPSDPNITVTFTASTNTFVIVNNTGNALTQFYWVTEYLKN
jgi:hypothetical protein